MKWVEADRVGIIRGEVNVEVLNLPGPKQADKCNNKKDNGSANGI